MHRYLKIGLGALVALLIGGPGVAAASAPTTTVPALTANAAVRLAAPPPSQPAFEASYVPITPCRIIDTREGTGTGHTPIGNLQTRTYYVGGTFGFAPQGGKPGGCGIPVGATAVATTFIAVDPTNKGGIRAWPNGQTEPTANVLNYGTFTMTGNPTVTINPSTAYSLKIRNYTGPTDLVVDVFGYYVKPLAGMISDSGSPYSGSSRILGATRTATGVYEVKFDRNIRYCAATATVYVNNNYAVTSTWFDSSRPDTVQVRLFNSAGAAVNSFFYVSVSC